MTTGTTKGNFSKYRSYHLLGLSHQLIYQNNKLIFLQIYLLWSKFFIVLLSLSYLFEKYKVYTSEVRCIITGDYQFKIGVFCLQKDQNRPNLTDTQTGRQTERAARQGSPWPPFPVWSGPAPVWGQNVWKDRLTAAVTLPPSPALDLTVAPAGGALSSRWPSRSSHEPAVLDETERGASDFLI